MDPIAALHNAARAWLARRITDWHAAYADLCRTGQDRGPRAADGGRTYSDGAYATFPRYLALEAILSDVEGSTADGFRTVNDLRAFLLLAAGTAVHDLQRRAPSNATEARAIADERAAASAFFATAEPGDWDTFPILPFRRRLSPAEHAERHEAVRGVWGTWYGGYTDATDDAALPPHATLHTRALADHPDYAAAIRAVLRGRGAHRLFELREWGDGLEIDPDLADFTYTGAEGLWTTEPRDWLIYASHESSITFGGAWLVEAVRALLPRFQLFIYRGWDDRLYPP